MAKGPTVYDVAELAGVSIATVSFAFRQPHRVKEATRDVVLEAARALGYVPSASARGLARGRTGALGLFSFDYLLEDPERPPDPDAQAGARIDANADFRLFPLYVDEVQRGVEMECWRRGFALMIGGGNYSSGERVLEDIVGRVDGLMIFPRTVPDDVLRRISARIPVVELSEPSHQPNLHHVTVENFEGMRALTEHLITVHGLRKLRFVGELLTSDNTARFEGYTAAIHAAGLQSTEALFSRTGVSESTAAMVATLITDGALPEALVCATDQEALIVLDALRSAGIDVPGQVAVTGFDGIVAGRIVRPGLTTVRQPMELMGRTAVELLIAALGEPGAAPAGRQLPVRLVIRESCGCSPD